MRRHVLRASVIAAVAVPLLAPMLATAAEGCEVNYRITPRYDTTPRRLDLELRFPAAGRDRSWIQIGSGWAGVKDFDAQLSDWRRDGAAEGKTDVERSTTAPQMIVTHPPQGEVVVRWHANAALADPDDPKRAQDPDQLYRVQVGPDWFQFFGYAALPAVQPWSDHQRGRLCVVVHQPDSAVGPLLGTHWHLYAARAGGDVEVAVDGTHVDIRHAFYAGGPGWRVQRRTLASGDVISAFRGATMTDEGAFADASAALLDVQRRFWGATKEPVQTLAVQPSHGFNSGGTLVKQTAVMSAPQGFGPTHPSYGFLVAHENLHQWFPSRLGNRNTPQGENAAKDYWLSEGFTNYYTHRLELSAGLWTLDLYAANLTGVLRQYWRSPARNASADSIAPRFFSDRDAGQQMYSRGELLAMRWDLALRAQGRPDGLDGVLRGMMVSPQEAQSLPRPALRVPAALDELLGEHRASEDVKRYVVEGQDLPLTEDLTGPCFRLGWKDVTRWRIGFDQAASLKAKTVTGVEPDGPAWKAGLRDGMTLQGWSIFGGDVTREVELTVKTDEGPKPLKFLPVDGSTERLPDVTLRPGAASDAACRAWVRKGDKDAVIGAR